MRPRQPRREDALGGPSPGLKGTAAWRRPVTGLETFFFVAALPSGRATGRRLSMPGPVRGDNGSSRPSNGWNRLSVSQSTEGTQNHPP